VSIGLGLECILSNKPEKLTLESEDLEGDELEKSSIDSSES